MRIDWRTGHALQTELAKVALDYQDVCQQLELLRDEKRCALSDEEVDHLKSENIEKDKVVESLERSITVLKESVANKELSIEHMRKLHEESLEELSGRIEASLCCSRKVDKAV